MLDLAGPCVQCQGAGDLVNVCDELSKGFGRRLSYFKISLIAQGRVDLMGTGLDERTEASTATVWVNDDSGLT